MKLIERYSEEDNIGRILLWKFCALKLPEPYQNLT